MATKIDECASLRSAARCARDGSSIDRLLGAAFVGLPAAIVALGILKSIG